MLRRLQQSMLQICPHPMPGLCRRATPDIFLQYAQFSAPLATPRGWRTDAGIGLKGGLNFANVTSASSINENRRSGYVVGVFFGTPPMGLMGFRTEFLFSRQGYNLGSNTTTGSVNPDYLVMPSLMVINLGKVAQIQAGGQIAYLLHGSVSGASTGDPSTFTGGTASFFPSINAKNNVVQLYTGYQF